MFNAGNYWRRAVLAGEFSQEIVNSYLVSDPEDYNCPEGTLSQEIVYHSREGDEIARVHQFLPPGGEVDGEGLPILCAGGKPDPKRLREGDTLYRLRGDRRRPKW